MRWMLWTWAFGAFASFMLTRIDIGSCHDPEEPINETLHLEIRSNNKFCQGVRFDKLHSELIVSN